jgi:hypothetical protein
METFENQITESSLIELQNKVEKSAWKNSKYELVKLASTTQKGNFGEDVTKKAFNSIGIECVIKNEQRRGDWDTQISMNALNKYFENKLATEDTHGNFQFNGVKLNREYDFLFCLGVSHNQLYFKIISKSELETKKEWSFGSMTKKNETEDKQTLSYKVTIPKSQMIPMDEFQNFDFNSLF